MSQLPPLPEPDTHCFDDDTGKEVWSYSEAQMLALQAATVEACAKVCENISAVGAEKDCADAIRSLK